MSEHDAAARIIKEWSPDGPIWQAGCSCGWQSPNTYTWTWRHKATDEANAHLRAAARGQGA